MAPNLIHSQLTEPADTELSEYRSLSGWAVAGLIAGLLSPLALADPLLWAMPMAAILICCRALWQIRSNAPALIGRKAALAGLWLAVFSLSAAYGDWYYFRCRISGEAQQTALHWFDLIAENRPELAFQLILPPQERSTLNERIWDFYTQSDKWREALENYVAPAKTGQPPQLVRTLLALGDKAQVRYVKTIDYLSLESFNVLDQLYAVTFDESGKKKTFFVTVQLVRLPLANGRSTWRVLYTTGGVDEDGKIPIQNRNVTSEPGSAGPE